MTPCELMREYVDAVAAGHSGRSAERACGLSHSTVSRWLKLSRERNNDYVFDEHYFHEHVETAKAIVAQRDQLSPWPRRGAAQIERLAPEPEQEFDPAAEAHKVELLATAPPGPRSPEANADPWLRHPRAHWSVNSDLRPALADAVAGGTRAMRIDAAGRGKQAPPADETRTVVSSRRYTYSERVRTGPLGLRDAKGNILK